MLGPGEVISAGVIAEVDVLIYVVLDGGKDDLSAVWCYIGRAFVDEGREDAVKVCV